MPNGVQAALPLGVVPFPWPGLLPQNSSVQPAMPLLRPVQVGPGFAPGMPLHATPAAPAAAATAAAPGAQPAVLAAAVRPAVAATAVQPPGAAPLGMGPAAVQPAAGDKRKADVALGQPLGPPPPMAPPPVLGVPMLPPPVTAATAVLGQPLNGPPPLGPLPLFRAMGAASPGPAPGAAPGAVAAAAPAAGVPSGSTQLEPSSDAGVEEEQPAGEAGGAGGSGRKSRLVWTQELHNRFINALSHLVRLAERAKGVMGVGLGVGCVSL